jgi:hypothetical protein
MCAGRGNGTRRQGAPVPPGPRRDGPLGRVRTWVRSRPADVVDVFVYVVILNLFVEYLPAVISEGFTLSLLTAGLLKIALELVLRAKSTILTWFRGATTGHGKVLAGVTLWVVAAGSKIAVLELVDVVFGDRVSLGGFVSVTALVIVLLLSRAGVRRLLYGPPASSPARRS